MSNNPADIGSRPVDFTGTDSIDIFHTPFQGYEVPSVIPYYTFGFSRGSRCVQEIEWIGCEERNTCHRISIHECIPVSYTHLRAHETDSYLVCRLLLEKKNK